MRPLFRPDPVGPAAAYKTYEIRSPRSTHWRPATCEQVDCAAYLHGWSTTVDTGTELGQGQAYYIRKQSGRSFQEEPAVFDFTDSPGLVAFVFPPGQRCFRSDTHRIRLTRPEIFVVRGGDWRGNPAGTSRQHQRPEHWVEDFAQHQDRISTRLQRG